MHPSQATALQPLLLLSCACLLLLTTFVHHVVALEVFRESFFNENLPGSVNDPESFGPNIPFSISIARYSDGSTSSSYFDYTSPHFPIYNASLADVSDRYLRDYYYRLSAESQGICIQGEGDARREEARLKITSQPGYQNLPIPSKTFPVYAAIKWNPSDFAIQEGETYDVKVEGNMEGYGPAFWYDGGLRVNANGYESYFDAISACFVGLGRCRSHLKKKRRLISANWMSLVCAIGRFVRPLVDAEPGLEDKYRWLPLDEAELQETIFNVGKKTQFRATYSGQLICFANDAQTLYWNNAGYLNVTVSRAQASWPPKPTTYYTDLYLPACDAAQVVYKNKGINDNNDPKKVKCNPNGGGAGWKMSDILANTARYGTGAPESYLLGGVGARTER